MTTPPARAELLAQLGSRLSELIPGARVLAERVLGADSRIDFVAAEPSGRVILVLVGEEGQDLELIGRGLAQRAWVEARLRDWLQLAPSLGIRPEAGTKVWLLCPSVRPESVAAARQVGSDSLAWAVYRCVRNGSRVETLLEIPSAARTTPEAWTGAPAEPAADGTGFRTGLADSDLGITAAEHTEFD
ncbi:MAG: hypothetical protein V3T07_00440 [Myxococcota bacterium]